MSSALGLIFCFRGLRRGQWLFPVAAIALLLFVLALARPQWLETPRRLWLRFGEALSRITQPIILGIVYYGVLTPTGVLRRRFGKSRFQMPTRSPDGRGPATHWTVLDKPQAYRDDYLRKPF